MHADSGSTHRSARAVPARHARAAAAFVAFLAVAGCAGNGSGVPDLALNATADWCDGDPRFLTGSVKPNGAVVGGVYVEYARNAFPTGAVAPFRTGPVGAVPPLYTFELPADFDIARGQLVNYRLVAQYTPPGAFDERELRGAPGSQRYCCQGTTFEEFLRADQDDIVARFAEIGAWPGYPGRSIGTDNPYRYVASHGKCCYAGEGMVIARLEDAEQLILGYPNALFYAPDPSTAPEDLCDRSKDRPYTLIGWAYTVPYRPGAPPDAQCFPHEEWFVHEAGYHYLNSGDFCPTPPEESVAGETVVVRDCDDVAGDAPCVERRDLDRIEGCRCAGCLRQWHERLYDIHVWRNDGGTPVVSFEHPQGEPAACVEVPPEGSFFYPALAP